MPLESELKAGLVTDTGRVAERPIEPGAWPELPARAPAEPKGLLAASFENNNPYARFWQPEGEFNDPEPEFNLAKELRARGRENDFEKLAWVNNRKSMERALGDLDRWRENERIIGQYPWWMSVPAGVATGMADPLILLPAGNLVKGVKGGYSISRTALSTSLWGGLGAGASEAALQASRFDRGAEDMAITIGAGVVLGGLLGAGGAVLLNRFRPPTLRAAEHALMRANGEPPTVVKYNHKPEELRQMWDEHGLPAEQFDRWVKLNEFKSVNEIKGDLFDMREGLAKGGEKEVKEYVDSIEEGDRVLKKFEPDNVITVWHASPHDFDKFDLSKIGTGEGAQVFGRGLYFAESEAVSGRGGKYAGKFGEGSHVYRVEIQGNKDEFINWDKSFDDQSEYVKRALLSFPNIERYEIDKSSMPLGEKIKRGLIPGSFDHTSPVFLETLRGLGIKGIKYLDQLSRKAGKGTHNFVVFDDKLLDIVEKNGIPTRAVQDIQAGHPIQELHEVGAAVNPNAPTRIESRDVYNVSGGFVNRLSKVGRQMIPSLRSIHSMFGSVRKTMSELTGGNVHLDLEKVDGIAAQSGGANNLMKKFYGETFGVALREVHKIHREMKKAGINMKFEDFDMQVGRAMRLNDQSDNEFIARAAKVWRDKLVTPFTRMAQDNGSLPRELGDVVGAASYFHRSHNRDMLIQHRDEFYRRLTPHAQKMLENANAEQLKELNELIDEQTQQIAILRMGRGEREDMLRMVDKSLEDLGKTDMASRRDEMKELRKAIKDTNDPKLQADLKQRLVELQKAQDADPRYKDYLKLKEGKSLLNMSFGGMEDKADSIIASLEDIAEDQLASTNRLIKKGQAFQKLHAGADQKKWEEAYDGLVDSFKQQAYRLKKSQDTIADQLKRIDEERAKFTEVKGETNFEKIKNQQAMVAKFDQKMKPVRARLEKEAKRIADAELKMDRINERIARAEGREPEKVMEAFRLAMAEMQQDVATLMTFRGMRAQRLIERLNEVTPEVVEAEIAKRTANIAKAQEAYDGKWNELRTNKSINEMATQMVDDYYNSITGLKQLELGDYADWVAPVKVGPLKGRINWVPEDLLTQPVAGTNRGFLHDDASHVWNHYARTMAGDVALRQTTRLGDIGMKGELDDLVFEHKQAQAEIDAATSVDEIKKIIADGVSLPKDLQAAKQKARAFADVQLDTGYKDLEAIRDMILNRYKVQENASTFGRGLRALNQIQYLRLMGGVVLSSLTEAFRPAFVHGLREYTEHVIKPMIYDFEAIKLGVEDARRFGLVNEMTHMHRIASFAEIGDPMGRGSLPERFLDNLVSFAHRWNGLAAWTDLGQAQSAILSTSRILETVMSGDDKQLLRFLNISADDEKVIKAMFEKHGEIRSGVHITNVHKWTEGLADRERLMVERAANKFGAALRKDVDSMIVMSSPGDAPLFASTPIGKTILQFRSYNMSAHQKVMMRGLQEHPARFISGLTISAIGGAGIAAAQAWRGGDERWNKFKQSAENPGFLIGEGLDRSGIFPMLFDVSNVIDSTARSVGGSFNPVKTPLLWPFPQQSQAGDQTRWAIGSGAWFALGPSAQFLFKDIPRGVGAGGKAIFSADDLSKSEQKALADLVLYKNYYAMNSLLLWMTDRWEP